LAAIRTLVKAYLIVVGIQQRKSCKESKNQQSHELHFEREKLDYTLCQAFFACVNSTQTKKRMCKQFLWISVNIANWQWVFCGFKYGFLARGSIIDRWFLDLNVVFWCLDDFFLQWDFLWIYSGVLYVYFWKFYGFFGFWELKNLDFLD
jgi:hypothetical protein